jgi:hypothetical protein
MNRSRNGENGGPVAVSHPDARAAWERACPPPPGSLARGRWAALLEAPERGCYDDK